MRVQWRFGCANMEPTNKWSFIGNDGGTWLRLRACLKIARGPAAAAFAGGQGGLARASPKRAVRAAQSLLPANFRCPARAGESFVSQPWPTGRYPRVISCRDPGFFRESQCLRSPSPRPSPPRRGRIVGSLSLPQHWQLVRTDNAQRDPTQDLAKSGRIVHPLLGVRADVLSDIFDRWKTLMTRLPHDEKPCNLEFSMAVYDLNKRLCKHPLIVVLF
jgi:hypothetical protein